MHLNIVAILGATLASYVLGSLWYHMLGKSWRAAVGWTENEPTYRPTLFELGVGLVGQLILAVALSGLLAHMGGPSVRIGLITAFGVWIGFVLPTLSTNVIFQRRVRNLIWQDGLHWLLILATQGAVIGAMG